MARKAGLGKGLSALVEQTQEEVQGESFDLPAKEIEIKRIRRNPNQPRTLFAEDDLAELSASIAEVGVLQPIIVRSAESGYEIVAGERRYQAAIRAGLKTIPAIVREADDTSSLEIALIENIQRSDLNSIEEARAYRELVARLGITQEELAKKLGKSRSAVTNALRLLELPEEVQAFVYDGSITAGHARAILGVPNDEHRVMIAKKVAAEKLTVRQTESLVALFSVEQADKSPRPTMPSAFKKIARQLRRDLHTGVKIKQVKGQYKIEIDFTDQDELERIVALMKSE